MERLKAWLLAKNIRIVHPGIGDDGLITLNLRPPAGADFQVGFYPDDLETDPGGVIELVEAILANRGARDRPTLG